MRHRQSLRSHTGHRWYISLISFILLSCPVNGYAMSLFKEKCLFSEVNGVVLSAGKPVAVAEVDQYYKWENSNKSSRKVVETDSDGRFNFAAVFDNSLFTTLIPSNPVIQQKIYIRNDDQEYEAYLYMKKNYDNNGELDGKPLNLVCELDNEPSRDGGFYGVCTLGEEYFSLETEP